VLPMIPSVSSVLPCETLSKMQEGTWLLAIQHLKGGSQKTMLLKHVPSIKNICLVIFKEWMAIT
jgi:hypothetical protein